MSYVPNMLCITQVTHSSEQVMIETVPRLTSADRPIGGTSSERVHIFCRRVVQDLPWQSRPVTLHVAARRFHCIDRSCARRTFVERLPDVARLYGRQTDRLRDVHHHLDLALGGETGARLASRLAAPISPDTLLRPASSCLDNGAQWPTPQMLGIDDWAWRRGHRYGTGCQSLASSMKSWRRRESRCRPIPSRSRSRSTVHQDGAAGRHQANAGVFAPANAAKDGPEDQRCLACTTTVAQAA